MCFVLSRSCSQPSSSTPPSSSSSVAESDEKTRSVRVEQVNDDLGGLEKLARVGVYNEHIDVSHIDERKLMW